MMVLQALQYELVRVQVKGKGKKVKRVKRRGEGNGVRAMQVLQMEEARKGKRTIWRGVDR